MKEKNEEILKLWRNTGFLHGLKEGSQNEWRCAESFDLMAKYLLNENTYNKMKIRSQVNVKQLLLNEIEFKECSFNEMQLFIFRLFVVSFAWRGQG